MTCLFALRCNESCIPLYLVQQWTHSFPHCLVDVVDDLRFVTGIVVLDVPLSASRVDAVVLRVRGDLELSRGLNENARVRERES
jgi:hypothetical protein